MQSFFFFFGLFVWSCSMHQTPPQFIPQLGFLEIEHLGLVVACLENLGFRVYTHLFKRGLQPSSSLGFNFNKRQFHDMNPNLSFDKFVEPSILISQNLT